MFIYEHENPFVRKRRGKVNLIIIMYKGYFKHRIEKSTLKIALISLLIAMIIMYFLQSISIVFDLSNVKIDTEADYARLQCFYLGIENEFSEERSETVEINNGELTINIPHKFFIRDVVRIDVDGVESFNVDNLKLKFNNYVISTSEQLNVLNSMISVQDMVLKEDGLEIVGDDPNIILDLQFSQKMGIVVLWIFIEFSVIFIVVMILIYSIYLFAQKSPILFKKTCRIGMYSIVIALVLVTDFQIYKSLPIGEKQHYSLAYSDASFASVSNEEFSDDFTCVGKKMLTLELDCDQLSPDINGEIEYEITDSQGKRLYICEEQLANSVKNERLILDVSKVKLIQGENYVLKLRFANCEGIAVKMARDNLLLIQGFEASYIWVYILILVFSNIFLFAFLYKTRNGVTNRSYLILSICIGIMFVFVMPPANRDDEWRHFVRAYTLAQGEFTIERKTLEGDEVGNIAFDDGKGYIVSIPKELNELRLVDYSYNYNEGIYADELNGSLCLDKLVSIYKSDMQGDINVSAAGVATRGMLYYWPQTLFIWLGMLIDASPMFFYYLARIGQLAVCTIFGWLSVHLTPKNKYIIWMVSFVPQIALLKSSCNPDAMLIAEIMLLMAIFLKIRDDKIDLFSRVGIRYIAVIFLLSINIILLKLPCFILCAILIVALNRENLQKIYPLLQQRKYRVGCGILVVCVSFSVLIFRNKFLELLYKFIPSEHLEYILAHPKEVFWMFFNKFCEQLVELVNAINGGGLLPYGVIAAISLILLKNSFSLSKKILFTLAILIYMGMIILFGYVISPPGGGQILGISFRYMLPLVPVLAIVLPSGNTKTNKVVEKSCPVFITTCIITAVMNWSIEFMVG